MSRDGRLVWVVNPGADTVTVIRTSYEHGPADAPRRRRAAERRARPVQPLRVRRERRGQLGQRHPDLEPEPDERVPRPARSGALTTGAEPWNVVVSPDGRRAFVANSGQDTITVIDALQPADHRQRRPHPRPLRRTRPQPPLPAARPRGRPQQQPPLRHELPRVHPPRRQAGRRQRPPGRRLPVERRHGVRRHRRLPAREADHARAAGHRLHRRPRRQRHARPDLGVPQPAPEHRDPRRPGVPAEHRRLAGRAAALRRLHAGVRQHGQRRSAPARSATARPARFLNLHLGARDPEPGKKKLFFANAWAIGFTNQSGAGLRLRRLGRQRPAREDPRRGRRAASRSRATRDTTRYIDLNDPANPATAGANAGKNPQGIVVNAAGTRAYVANFVSRNVSVVDLRTDRVIKAIQTSPPATDRLDRPGRERRRRDVLLVARQLRPPGECGGVDERAPADERLAVVLELPLQGPDRRRRLGVRHRAAQVRAAQRHVQPAQPEAAAHPQLLRRSSTRSTTSRSTSATSPARARSRRPSPCSAPAARDEHARPRARAAHRRQRRRQHAAVRAQRVRQAERRPRRSSRSAASAGARPRCASGCRAAVRTPNGPLPRTQHAARPARRRRRRGARAVPGAGLPDLPRRADVHGSVKDFASPPAAAEIATETTPPATTGNPVAAQYLNRFLRDIGSFNLGVTGAGNDIGGDVGAVEKATAGLVGGSRSRSRTRSGATTTATARASATTSRRCSASTPSRPTTTTARASRSPAWSAMPSTGRRTAGSRTACSPPAPRPSSSPG